MIKFHRTEAMLLSMALFFLSPVFAADGKAQDKVQVQWLGQSAFNVTTVGGKVIVIDPWLTTNPKTPEAYRKHEALGKVDLILVTHGHADHFGDTPTLAKLSEAPVWAPAGLSQSDGPRRTQL